MPQAKCCKDCSKRCVGCHSSCEEYLSFREELDEFNKKVAESKALVRDADYIRLQSTLDRRAYMHKKSQYFKGVV